MKFTLGLCASVLLLGVLVSFGVIWVAGTIAAKPAPAVIDDAPVDLPIETVSFDSASGSRLAGWLIRGEPGAGVVVLMHGVRANRLQMLGRARFLHRAGFSVLLFDFQASGMSAGRAITFGYLESRDASAALAYVRQLLPRERVGVIGMSMGGAAVILSDPPPAAEAMVLEAVFATFDEAVKNRLQLYLGTWARVLSPALTWQIKPRLGFDPDVLQPVREIVRVRAPLLMIAGAADRHATLPEMTRLYDRAQAPKDLWVIDNAAHTDFHTYAPTEYERRILAFLTERLRS